MNANGKTTTTLAQWMIGAGLLLALAGCESADSLVGRERETLVAITPSSVRSARRAFAGAPPVIPHPPLGAACVSCHTETGKAAPPVGMAPANPHRPGDASVANCRQCHVFVSTTTIFQSTSFQGLAPLSTRGERLFPGAPPVIPHRHTLHENCNGCHSGPVARPELRGSHPERHNCHQCHLVTAHPPGPLSSAITATSDERRSK